MSVTMTPPSDVQIDSGVIEEARGRQRRRQITGIALGVGVVVIAISALVIGGGGEGNSGAVGSSPSGGPLS